MSLLICVQCKQVPYIEFMPGLHIKFICCNTKIVRHYDLDKFIEQNYTLKCQKCSCLDKDGNIILYSKKLICKDCRSKISAKNKEAYIKNDSIPNKCALNDNKKYEFYDPKTHRLYCQYCLIKSAVQIKDYEKAIKIEIINIPKNSFSSIPYFDNLGNKIIKTYEMMKKTPAGINSYLNLLNLKKFLEDYSMIVPLCNICKEIFNFDISENTQNNSFEISCKCGKKSFPSLEDFEIKIDLIKCDNCEKELKQSNMFLDFLTQDILCEKCLNEKGVFDYIRYNEIPYICDIHTNKFISFCNICGKFLCDKCDAADHNIIEIKASHEDDEKKYKIFSNSKWFLKLKGEGFLNLKSERVIHENKNGNILAKFQEYKDIIENEEKKGLDILSNKLKIDLAINLGNIKFLVQKIANLNLEEEILNLKNQLNKMTLSIELLFKEFSDKNKIVQLLKTRNVLQHIFTEIIKDNYDCFEKIEGNFRVLYESYKYLNYEKKNCDEVKLKIESIFKKFEILIKSHVKNTVKECLSTKLINELELKHYEITKKKKNAIRKQFNSNDDEKKNFNEFVDKILPKVSPEDKIILFNKVFESPIKKNLESIKNNTIKQYNDYLIQQKAFAPFYMNRNKETLKDIEKILLKYEFPKDYEKSGLFQKINLTENDYIKSFGYLNDYTLDNNLIKVLLQNSQKDDEYHYLLLKKDKSEEFLKKVGCENDAEFYFLTMLSSGMINRIGKIIHQNDAAFQFLFYNIEDNLNIENYSLINEKEKKEPKFKINNKSTNKSLNNLNYKNFDISSIFRFTEELATKNFQKMSDFLGENEVTIIKKKINDKFKSLGKIDNAKKEIASFGNKIEKYILFINKYKEMLILFPQIKENLTQFIEMDDYPSFEEFDYIPEENGNYFANVFFDMYSLTIYFLKNKNVLLDETKKYKEKYQLLLDNYYQLEIVERIYNLLKSEINKNYDVLDYFEQEKKNIADIFLNFFAKKTNSDFQKKLNKGQNEIFKEKLEDEQKMLEDTVKKLQNISLNDIETRFKNYLDFDILSFTQAKFDVILFLYQNKFI